MAWFDEFNLPGATIDGYFGFVRADGADDNDYPDVVLANGTVTFTATTEAARIDGAWLGIQPVTAQIFEGQIVISEEDPRPVRLLATDAPIGVADWAWRASFNVPGFRLNDLTFRAPRDTTVNLTADLIPIKSQPYQIIEGASIVDAEVSGEGTMRFELSDGTFTSWMDVPNGERGVPGPPGEQGDPGADGAAATLSMGSVTAGTTADAWMTGTPLVRELNLTLPRGAKGERGETGPPGPEGPQGVPGTYAGRGDSAYQVAVAEGFSGTEADWLASLKGERGEKGESFDRGRIPNGSDVFTLASGSWTVSSAGFAETMTNLPEAWPGRFTIENGGEPIVKAAQFRPYDRDYHWETVRAIGGTWMPWRKVGKGEHPAYAPNAIRQAQMIHHYGPVDTAGRGAVAWRIDHGLANFKAKMLPIFRAAGIVPMITLNSRSWDHAENAGVTPAEVNQWVADGWVEISNHGATHSNVEGDAAIEAYVAEGLAELEQQLPAAKGKIFGFHIAGVGVQGAFGGFQGGDTPARWDTVMGRAILTHHAFGSGYVPDTNLRVLDGQIRQGLYHTGTDTAEVSTITGLIDQAIATRRGLQIMSHPSNMDTEGYHSTADIQAIVDHIVAKRDAGDLAVLSPYQLMVADSTRTAPAIADVDGLAARLAALEYRSGRRNITSLISPAPTSGKLYIERRGDRVWLHMDALTLATTTDTLYSNVIPSGFQIVAPAEIPAAQRSALDAKGGLRTYGGTLGFYYLGQTPGPFRGMVSWPTNQLIPTTLPGTPA